MLHDRALRNLLFHWNGGDVLTSGRNDDVLLAAGDRDAPLIVNRGKISGA